MTIKFLGGNVSAIQASFDSPGAGDGSAPWSSFFGVNGTYSHATWNSDLVVGNVWKAQANRTANWRLRVTGPCYVI